MSDASRYAHVPHPDRWQRVGGMGSCFHQALSRWALKRDEGETGWKLAIGIVRPELNDDRHVHAWLQHGERVLMAVDGSELTRENYYRFMGVERASVRYVNPRALLRSLRGPIDRHVVKQLLDLWGLPYRTNEAGGVVPAGEGKS